jgi:biopolymer transport protein ExbD
MGMSGGGGGGNTAVPYINVTPLIDVLLVLLIIFMVISPQKPHKFETKAPEKPPENQTPPPPDPLTLVVSVSKNGGYKLNQTEAANLSDLNRLLHNALDGRPPDRKAVFVKAPNATRYGQVVDMIDTIKEAGGSPIGLQLEGLDE